MAERPSCWGEVAELKHVFRKTEDIYFSRHPLNRRNMVKALVKFALWRSILPAFPPGALKQTERAQR